MRPAVVATLGLAILLCACSSSNSGLPIAPGSRASNATPAPRRVAAPGSRAGAPAPSAGTGSGASLSPQDLLAAVLNGSPPSSLLPQGFSAPMATQAPLTDVETKHNALGKVVIALSGHDTQDEIGITVYPSAADAAARWKEPLTVDPSEVVASNTTPPGFTQPALLLGGTVTSKDALGQTQKAGFTSCFVLVGNVEVAAATVSTANAASGNVPATLALAHAGIAYLTNLATQ